MKLITAEELGKEFGVPMSIVQKCASRIGLGDRAFHFGTSVANKIRDELRRATKFSDSPAQLRGPRAKILSTEMQDAGKRLPADKGAETVRRLRNLGDGLSKFAETIRFKNTNIAFKTEE